MPRHSSPRIIVAAPGTRILRPETKGRNRRTSANRVEQPFIASRSLPLRAISRLPITKACRRPCLFTAQSVPRRPRRAASALSLPLYLRVSIGSGGSSQPRRMNPRFGRCAVRPAFDPVTEPSLFETTYFSTVPGRMIMKWILASVCLLAIASISPAGAKGCIKGAIVGGLAGHLAGHGKVGAAAGCVIGHHEANKPNPNNSNAQAPSGQK
jgi:hypothetical protein